MYNLWIERNDEEPSIHPSTHPSERNRNKLNYFIPNQVSWFPLTSISSRGGMTVWLDHTSGEKEGVVCHEPVCYFALRAMQLRPSPVAVINERVNEQMYEWTGQQQPSSSVSPRLAMDCKLFSREGQVTHIRSYSFFDTATASCK